MEAGEYGITLGTCFVPRCLEVVAVADLLWISWFVLGAAGFCFFFCLFIFERNWPAASVNTPCLIYLSTSKSSNITFLYVKVIIVHTPSFL